MLTPPDWYSTAQKAAYFEGIAAARKKANYKSNPHVDNNRNATDLSNAWSGGYNDLRDDDCIMTCRF